MKLFSDVPEWYMDRIRRMYRKQAAKVQKCPHFNSVNHLLKPCPKCDPLIKQTWEIAATARVVDRIYVLHKGDKVERHYLMSLVRDRQIVQTSLEFPTPKIAYRNLTRMPQFYSPITNSVIDCYATEEELWKYSKSFVTQARTTCGHYKCYYDQVVVADNGKLLWHRQPRSLDVESMVQRLLSTGI